MLDTGVYSTRTKRYKAISKVISLEIKTSPGIWDKGGLGFKACMKEGISMNYNRYI